MTHHAPTCDLVRLQRIHHTIPLAGSHEQLVALLDGSATAADGDLPLIASGSIAHVIDGRGTTLHVAIAHADGRYATGWVPAAWASPVTAEAA